MATYKRDELRNAVLTEVGALDGQSTQGNPQSDDAKLATDVCQQELEYLFGEGLIPFSPDGDEIPGGYFRALVWVIAPSLVAAFGTVVRSPKLDKQQVDGMKRLSRLKESRVMGSVVPSEFF
jgi:hypothetical protein